MSILTSPMTRYPKSLWSYNPIPGGCVLYLPLWHPSLSGPVFKSVDPFGHPITVTGAVYSGNKLGRFFDQDDDIIACLSPAAIDDIFDGGGSVITWLNFASDGEINFGRIWDKVKDIFYVNNEAASKLKVTFTQSFSDTNGTWTTTATAVTINTPTMLALTYNNGAVGNNPILYIASGGTVSTLTVGSGLTEDATPVGTRTTDASNNLNIGADGGTAAVADGYIMEQNMNESIITAEAVAYYYNQTRGLFE